MAIEVQKNLENGGKIMENMQTWEFPQLIERFVNDIVYDCHSLVAKFERSHAQNELFRRQRETLRPAIEYIRGHHRALKKESVVYPLVELDLNIAWNMLFNRIEIQIDPEKTAPKNLRDVEGWLAWAERFAV